MGRIERKVANATDAERRSEELTLSLEEGFRFRVDFGPDGPAGFTLDEPPPAGGGDGPNASAVLAAAVGHCLSASALFCLRKARVPVADLRTQVRTTLRRNEAGRWRIETLHASLEPEVAEEDRERMARCLELFEDFCIVTQSVRAGIDVEVEVTPRVRVGAGAAAGA